MWGGGGGWGWPCTSQEGVKQPFEGQVEPVSQELVSTVRSICERLVTWRLLAKCEVSNSNPGASVLLREKEAGTKEDMEGWVMLLRHLP